MDTTTSAGHASFSVPSIIALIAAVASFAVGALWGFVLAVVAIFFGLIGTVMAFSSRVRGGIVSVLSICAAVVAMVMAAIKAIAWLF